MYKRHWIVKTWDRGFEGRLIIYGTEEELWAYMTGEWGYNLAYSGATEDELAAAKTLKMKVYLAPDIKKSR